MPEDIFNLIVSSPDELKKFLAQSGNKPSSARLAALAVSDPQILTRLFQAESSDPKMIRDKLVREAVELLSLPVSEIELMFQVLGSSDGKAHGIYICIPRVLLHRYLWVLHRAQLLPMQIISYSAVCLSGFLKEPLGDGRVCFLNFAGQGMIYLTVVLQKKCELLREISYANWAEARAEILQSLRSVCAKSPVKDINRICILGEDKHEKELADVLRQDFHSLIECRPSEDMKKFLMWNETKPLNLAQNYIFPLEERKKIMKFMHMVIACLAVLCVVLGIKIAIGDRAVDKLKDSYSASEYQYAVELEKKIRSAK